MEFAQCATSKPSPPFKSGINASLFAICAFLKLWWLILQELPVFLELEAVHCALEDPTLIPVEAARIQQDMRWDLLGYQSMAVLELKPGVSGAIAQYQFDAKSCIRRIHSIWQKSMISF